MAHSGALKRTCLHAQAEQQRGLFTTTQALSAGFTRRELHGMRTRGEIKPVSHGDSVLRAVHRVAGTPYEWPSPVLAACLAVGGGAVACLDTALQLHGLRPVKPDIIHVCRPALWQPTVPGIVVHTTRDLIDGDRTELDSVPVASAARTVVDMARTLQRSERLALLDEVVFGGLAARRWVYRRASALQSGRIGVLDLVRATAPGAEAEFRSWLERQASRAFARFAVPPPRWNVRVDDAVGKIGIVDCLWPTGLVVEIEGLRFHTSPQQRRRDAARFNRLVRRGPVLRYTWQDVVERPEIMCREIREALGAVAPVPAG